MQLIKMLSGGASNCRRYAGNGNWSNFVSLEDSRYFFESSETSAHTDYVTVRHYRLLPSCVTDGDVAILIEVGYELIYLTHNSNFIDGI
jgi:hypothetical protein